MKKVQKQINKVQEDIKKSQKMIKDLQNIGLPQQNEMREQLVFDTVKNLNDYLIFNDDELTKSLKRTEKLFERIVEDEDFQQSEKSHAQNSEEMNFDPDVTIQFSEPKYSRKNTMNSQQMGFDDPAAGPSLSRKGSIKPPLSSPRKSSIKKPITHQKNKLDKDVPDGAFVDGVFKYHGSPRNSARAMHDHSPSNIHEKSPKMVDEKTSALQPQSAYRLSVKDRSTMPFDVKEKE